MLIYSVNAQLSFDSYGVAGFVMKCSVPPHVLTLTLCSVSFNSVSFNSDYPHLYNYQT